MSSSNFIIGEQIKEGENYTLLQAKHKVSNEQIVVKCCQPNYKGGFDRLLSYTQQLKNLTSKNLVRIYDILQDGSSLNIYQEYATQGNLLDFISQSEYAAGLSEKQAVQFLKQILYGYKELMDNGFTLRNLSMRNLLVKENQIKISDFSFITNILNPFNDQVVIDEEVEPSEYSSPQILYKQPYSAKCDIWSIGIIFYELLYFKKPYDFGNQETLPLQMQMPIHFLFSKPITNACRDFIEKCLQFNEQTRFSPQELFKHQLLKPDFDDMVDEIVNKSLKYSESMLLSRSQSTILQLREIVKKNNIDIDDIFNNFDKDKSGNLDLNEFTQLLLAINQDITQEECEKLFQKLDQNQSGTLRLDRFRKFLFRKNQITPIIKKVIDDIQLAVKKNNIDLKTQFKENDKESTGKLQYAEFFNLISDILVEVDQFAITQAFQFFDKDNKGYVAWSDFRNICSQDYEADVRDALLDDDYVELAKKELLDIKQVAKQKKCSLHNIFSQTQTLNDQGHMEFSEFKNIINQSLGIPHNQVFNLYQAFGNKKNKTISLTKFQQLMTEKSPETKQKALDLLATLKQQVKNKKINMKLLRQLEKDKQSEYVNYEQFAQIINNSIGVGEGKFLYNYLQEENGLVSLQELKYYLTVVSEECRQKALIQLERLKKWMQRNKISVSTLFNKLISKGQSELTQNDIQQIFKGQLSQNEVFTIIEYLDNNKSGGVSMEELQKYLDNEQQHVEIQKKTIEILKELKLKFQKYKIDYLQLLKEEKKDIKNDYLSKTEFKHLFGDFLTNRQINIIFLALGGQRNGCVSIKLIAEQLDISSDPQSNRQQYIKQIIVKIKQYINQKGNNLKQMFQQFDEECIGKLNQEQFSNMIKPCLTQTEIDDIFDYFDDKTEGSISFKELRRNLYEKSEVSQEEQEAMDIISQIKEEIKDKQIDLKELFSKYDTYDENALNIKQFQKMWNKFIGDEIAEFLFNLFDEDGSGSISYEELTRILA